MMSDKGHIRKITWYTKLLPYINMIELLRYNSRTGNVSFSSTIIIEDKYVRSEKEYKMRKDKRKNKGKFKMGRPSKY